LVLSAFRYALGRRSYIVSAIIPELKREILEGYMGERARGHMIDEITEAEKSKNDFFGGLGDDLNAKLWFEFRAWLLSGKELEDA
jgi:hypothetical protein